jgi:prepilin-type N-terminal cleavage/methylation domain-containing protein
MPRGFTLIELLIVIATFALLTAGGYLVTARHVQSVTTTSVAEMIAGEITHAQADAFAQTDDAAHGVTVFSDRVVRFTGSSYAARDASKDVTIEFEAELTISGTDEFIFPESSLSPSNGGTLDIELGVSEAHVAVSDYGVLEVTTGPVNP